MPKDPEIFRRNVYVGTCYGLACAAILALFGRLFFVYQALFAVYIAALIAGIAVRLVALVSGQSSVLKLGYYWGVLILGAVALFAPMLPTIAMR